MPGSGKLTITGQLGDVMKESAQAALSYVRGHWREIAPELDEDWFAKHDIHIHVPAGAVPKDGPSAGVAMTVALASLISGRPVRNDVAMTGEVTLTGQVLPIGGLKEKSLAAQRAGIKRVIVPEPQRGRRGGDPRARAQRARVRLRRRGLQGDRRGARLGDGGRRGAGQGQPVDVSARRPRGGALALARLLDRRRAHRRWPRRCASRRSALQGYHHDEIVTASRVLRGGFWHAMDAVGFSESAPPLYYALAWLWTQVTGTGEVGLRSLSARRRRRHRAGRLPDRRRAARPPRPGSSPRRWSRSTRCCSGTRRRRAPTRCSSCSRALSLLYFVRAPASAGGAATSSPGGSPRRSPWPPTTSPSSRSPPRPLWLLRRRGRRRRCPGSGSSPRSALAAGAAGAPPDVLRPRRMDRQLQPRAPALGDRRRPSWSARPATSSPARSGPLLALVPGAGRVAAFVLLLPARERATSAAPPRSRSAVAAATRRDAAAARPGSTRQGLRPRPQPAAGAGAAAGRGRDRPHPAPRPPRSAPRRRRAGRLLARLLRSGPASPRRCSAPTGRRSPPRSASRARRGRWSPGCSARRRCATTSRPAPSRSSPPKATSGWWARSTSSPTDRRRRRPPRLLGPGFRASRLRARSARLYIRRYVTPGPELVPLRLRERARRRARLPQQRGAAGRDRPGLTARPDSITRVILRATTENPARRRHEQDEGDASAADLYATARENPYVQRLIEDEELRDSLKNAFEAAEGAYGRATGNGKGAVKAVTSDKKVQKDLRNAAESLREASEQLRAPKKRKKAARPPPPARRGRRRVALASARTLARPCWTLSSAPRRSSSTRAPPASTAPDSGSGHVPRAGASVRRPGRVTSALD